MMERGIFEGVEGLPIVGMSDINFAYDTYMVGYPTLSLDILTLGETGLCSECRRVEDLKAKMLVPDQTATLKREKI